MGLIQSVSAGSPR